MFLYIDNSDEEKIILGIVDRKGTGRSKIYHHRSSRPLLFWLDKFLRTAVKKQSPILGVAVKIGAGRFTATRIAVTVANVLGYAKKIPVVAVTDFDPVLIARRLSQTKKNIYASARYSGAACIGGR